MLNEPNPRADLDVLPDGIKPLNYNLSIFDIEFGGWWTYHGCVKIAATAQATLNKIRLNSKGLDILQATVWFDNGTKQLKSTEIQYDQNDDRASLYFPEYIPAGNLEIEVNFKGTISNAMEGFYRAQYDIPEEHANEKVIHDNRAFLFVTHFEPCSARQAFPCFDEPHLKASFDLKIELPKDLVALSNMPESSTIFLDGSKEDLKVVSFERTPVMSTYLAAWAVGDFEYIEATTDREYNGRQIPVRVYTTRGLKEHGRFALKHACQVLDYYSETFGIDYPLPKCDHLVVHEFVSGAMENWGLITYKPTKILFDETTSDSKLKNKAAYVVAHELAHQWFGNLVTMNTWAELWLNEGFATWAAYLAVDHLYPEWQFWSQFVAEVMQEAFALDSLEASHPIEVEVESTAEAIQMFDSISYFKGSSVLRMLSNHIGQKAFLDGVSKYLKTFAYRNASSKDLWNALSETSGVDVQAFMDPWIRKVGYPLVTLTEDSSCLELQQQRFLASGKEDKSLEPTVWPIPLGACSASPANSGQVMMGQRYETTDLRDFCKLNKDNSGFYHTSYPSNRLERIGRMSNSLSVEDKAGLIGELNSLVFAGKKRTSELLQFLDWFREDDSYFVWSQISRSLLAIRSIFSTSETIMEGLQVFTKQLILPATKKVDWDIPRDDYVTGEFRKTILALATMAGIGNFVTEAKVQFSAWAAGQSDAVDPNLRSIVFTAAVVGGHGNEYEAVKQEYLKTSSIDGKEICLNAMGRSTDPIIIHNLLDFIFSDQVPLQNVHVATGALGSNGASRYLLWEYMKANWTAIHARLSMNEVVLNWTIQHGLCHFSDLQVEEDIARFFADKDIQAFASGLRVIKDSIKRNASYKTRDETELGQWLQNRGYI